jgi:hypothetical protein
MAMLPMTVALAIIPRSSAESREPAAAAAILIHSLHGERSLSTECRQVVEPGPGENGAGARAMEAIFFWECTARKCVEHI